MKKFKSMKKRDEKMESLLMEKWGYSAPILNEDGDKELLQEFVFLGLGTAAWATIAAVAAIGSTYIYSVYDEDQDKNTERQFNDTIAQINAKAKEAGKEAPAGDYFADEQDYEDLGSRGFGLLKSKDEKMRSPLNLSSEEEEERRSELSQGEQPIIVDPGHGRPPTPDLVVTSDPEGNELHAPPEGWEWEDNSSGATIPWRADDPAENINWNIVPKRELDPETTDIDPSLRPGSNTRTDGVINHNESKHTTREIVKEEISKYFSNRRKS